MSSWPEGVQSTHTPSDIFQCVSESAPALLPLFRSEQQLAIVNALFTGSDEELTIGQLADLADVSQQTVSREVARLEEHGLVRTRTLGRNRLVSANWELPWAKELTSILTQTVGVLGRLSTALATVEDVEEAYVFGSWAARHEGEPGPSPHDVDVLVVGDAALRDVRRACRTVESELRVEVNPVVISRTQWEAADGDPFVEEVRERPRVPITLGDR